MKKGLFILGMFAAARLFGQAVPNGGFENWKITPYDQPASWYSSNPQSIQMLDSINVTEVAGYSGNAVHMHTILEPGDTDFGYIVNNPGDPSSAQGGVPYAQMSTGITGYYRYNLPASDSALLWIIFKKGGSVIGQYLYKIRNATGNVATWTSFSYTFTPALTKTPDTVIIAAASSNANNTKTVKNGSWMELDQLAFTGPNTPIANGGFDTWNSNSFDIPIGWSISSGGPGGSGVSRSTTAYAGLYSVSLTSQSGGGHGINAAQISNGVQPQNNGPKGGQPYTLTNDTLFGYYQYSTPGNDSGNVNVSLTKNGTNVGGSGLELKKTGTWTAFKLSIQAFSTPDTILVSFASSVWTSNATIGSVLLLDNVYLKSQPLGILNIEQVNGTDNLYPNPAKDVVNIKVANNEYGSANVYIYDITGRMINESNIMISNNLIHMSIAKLQPGVYFCKIETTDGNSSVNKFVKQ